MKRPLLPSLVLASALAACGTPVSDRGGDSSTGGTGGTTQPPAPSTKHHSFIPETLRPTDAARLVVFGDSISAGYGASDPADAYASLLDKNDDAKWSNEAKTSLAAKFGHDVAVVNVSRPGAVTGDLAAQEASLEAELPGPVSGHSIVTITIGGNDLSRLIGFGGDPTGPALDDAMAHLRALVEKLQDPARWPDGTSIYLMAVYDPSDGVGQVLHAGPEDQTCFFGLQLDTFVSALDTWRDRYVALGQEKGIAVVDALGHFHGHGFHHADTDNPYYTSADATLWFAKDCIHPNDRGHDELRRLFFEALDDPWYVATP